VDQVRWKLRNFTEQFGAGRHYCCNVDCQKPDTDTGDEIAGSCQKYCKIFNSFLWAAVQDATSTLLLRIFLLGFGLRCEFPVGLSR